MAKYRSDKPKVQYHWKNTAVAALEKVARYYYQPMPCHITYVAKIKVLFIFLLDFDFIFKHLCFSFAAELKLLIKNSIFLQKSWYTPNFFSIFDFFSSISPSLTGSFLSENKNIFCSTLVEIISQRICERLAMLYDRTETASKMHW